MKKQIVFLLPVLMAVSGLYGQSGNTQKSMDEMLADADESRQHIILKTNPIAMFNGDFPIYAEVLISKKFSLEAGVGLVAGYFVHELTYIGKEPFAIEPDGVIEPTTGYSLRVFPRYYLVGGNMEGMAIGPFWRMRQYGIEGSDDKVRFRDLCFMYSQQIPTGKFFFEYYVGFGKRTKTFPEGIQPDKSVHNIVIPFGIKIGYSL